MSHHTPGPWRCLADNSLLDEPHFQVVGPAPGPALFDSINRSPVADEAAERYDMQLASAAPLMFAALLVAREFISIERNAFADCNALGNGTMLPEDQAELDDIDQLLMQIENAMAAASIPHEVTA